MSEQRRKRSSHEAKFNPVENNWEAVRHARDNAIDAASEADEGWEQFGGGNVDNLTDKLQSAHEDDKSSIEISLEQARWALFHSMVEAAKAFNQSSDTKFDNADHETRDEFIGHYERLRTTLRERANEAEDQWEAIGGAKLDQAEAIQAQIRAKGANATNDTEYQKAIRDVGEARNQVASNWQTQYGSGETETESASKRTRTSSKLGARAASMFGSKKRREHTETSRKSASADAKEATATEEKIPTSSPDESTRFPTETEARQEMEAQIESYKQHGHTDDSWEALQHSIGQYESLRNDRLKREINVSIDNAYRAAAEASETVNIDDETVNKSTSATETELSTSEPAQEATTATKSASSKAKDVTPKSKSKRVRKAFARTKRFAKRVRSRLNKEKYARSQNLTKLRSQQQSSVAPTVAFSASERADVENQPSLGGLVQTDITNEQNNYKSRSDDDREDPALVDVA